MYIFISHSSKDATVANEICGILESNDNTCFLAPRDIRSGHEYAAEIVNGIESSDAIMLLLSEEANKSPHVLREIERAVSKNIPIIVYKLEEVELTKSMEYFLMMHQWINAEPGKYEDVLKAVETLKSSMADKMQSEMTSTGKTTGATGQNKEKINRKAVIGVAALVLAVIIAVALFVAGVFDSEKNESSQTNGEQSITSTEVGGNNTTGGNADTENDEITEAATEKDTDDETENSSQTAVTTDVELGDTIVLGKYNDEDVYWKVIKISEDGTEAVVIARDIISVKAYDAAESGKYNYDGEIDYWTQNSEADTNMELQARVRGNSAWKASNIRTWLNATSEVVKYQDQPPVATAMSEMKNGYEYEAGFLNNFSDEELAAIKETEVKTKGNAISDEEIVATKDKVFLLSIDELKWLEDAGVSVLAMPTDAAIEKDQTNSYYALSQVVNVKPFVWWLREPVEGTSDQCYVVGNGYHEDNMWKKSVGVECYGIRPAMTVDLQSKVVKVVE